MSTATISVNATVTETTDFVTISNLSFKEASEQARSLVIALTRLPATEDGKKRFVNRNGNDVVIPRKFWDEISSSSSPSPVLEESVEVEVPDSVIDLSTLSKTQLLTLAKERGIKVNKRQNMAQLHAALS